ARHAAQHGEGATHAARIELVAVVEAAEHRAVAALGQTAIAARWRRWQRARGIGGLEAARQAHDALAVVNCECRRQGEAVGEHVVDPRRAGRAGIREPVDLYARRTHRQYFRRAAAAPAAQVEQEVDAGLADVLRDLRVRQA